MFQHSTPRCNAAKHGATRLGVRLARLQQRARIQSPAERVSGGAVYAANGAEGLFTACAFRSNSAGGLGYYDRKPAAYLEQSQARKAPAENAHPGPKISRSLQRMCAAIHVLVSTGTALPKLPPSFIRLSFARVQFAALRASQEASKASHAFSLGVLRLQARRYTLNLYLKRLTSPISLIGGAYLLLVCACSQNDLTRLSCLPMHAYPSDSALRAGPPICRRAPSRTTHQSQRLKARRMRDARSSRPVGASPCFSARSLLRPVHQTDSRC